MLKLLHFKKIAKKYKFNNAKCIFKANMRFLGEMQRIAFRLMLSSCVCVCLCVCVCECHVCGPQENGLR